MDLNPVPNAHLRDLAATFEGAARALRDLGRYAEGIEDRELLLVRIRHDVSRGRRAQWLDEPLSRLARFHAARHDAEEARAREVVALNASEAKLQQLRARHSRLQLGDLEARAVWQEAEGLGLTVAQLGANCRVLAESIERWTPEAEALLARAKAGLAALMELVLTVEVEARRERTEDEARAARNAAGGLLAVLQDYERLVARIEQETGEPVRAPRFHHPAREALERVAWSGAVEIRQPEPAPAGHEAALIGAKEGGR